MRTNHTVVTLLVVALSVLTWYSSLFTHADEPSAAAITWKQTRSLPAAEAHQAAAADEKFVYAIASDKVAKYDRKTGERVAISTGEAKHLNSGFFSGGKLYLAHSNYPRLPEQSEIRVLDPDKMQLDVFKDFGNFGGSLTWAVKNETGNAWWCCFAHYGAANDQTFLVRFNRNWEERGRWTFPPEVLRQIGTMSFSGGVWVKDDLLVTDHDHRVLYRLRVPSDGKVLEFVGKYKHYIRYTAGGWFLVAICRSN